MHPDTRIAQNGNVPPFLFRQRKRRGNPERDKQRHVGGPLNEGIIKPLRNAVGMELPQPARNQALGGFIHRAGPEPDERQEDHHGGQEPEPHTSLAMQGCHAVLAGPCQGQGCYAGCGCGQEGQQGVGEGAAQLGPDRGQAQRLARSHNDGR